jgi:glycosyltransferase involved in cell wall biosynthesis
LQTGFQESTFVRLCIVIPAYNEERTVAGTIREYRAAFPEARFVIVDNNSSDATNARARAVLNPERDFCLFERRQGKGYAVKTGLSRISADVYIVTDADATYAADDASRLLDILLELRADMLVGDRMSDGAYDKQNIRVGHSLGNRLLTWVISRLSGQRYNDVLSGLRVMSRPFVSALDVRSKGFQLETEMNFVAAYLRSYVVELPIAYRERVDDSISKLRTVQDGLHILYFTLTSWITFAPVQAFAAFALVALSIAGGLAFRVITGFIEYGWPYTTTAVAAAAAGISAILALFIGLTLRILGDNDRRRDIAHFLEAKRQWNAKLDGTFARRGDTARVGEATRAWSTNQEWDAKEKWKAKLDARNC